MEISGERLPEELKLCWAFGACDGADDPAVTDNSIPAASCFHNVFSIEGNAFTTYYGESMKLRTVHGVSPIGSDIRLSDGHKQASPLALFNSGKKKDAPGISALSPWKPQETKSFEVVMSIYDDDAVTKGFTAFDVKSCILHFNLTVEDPDGRKIPMKMKFDLADVWKDFIDK